MRILIVEDDGAARFAMQRYLEIEGHEVTAVGKPNDAFIAANAAAPRCIICDWELEAEIDGVDVARAIQDDHGAAVLFITGQNIRELQLAATDVDVTAFFQKPVSLAQISACLRQYGDGNK